VSALEVAQRPSPVADFLEGLKQSGEDEEARELRLQLIHGLVRFSQRFYIAFFREELGEPIRIKGFHYRDKRRVARRLIEFEDGEQRFDRGVPPEKLEFTRVELGGYFEQLVDSLQGDLDFGYSADIADFSEFHNELYPGWLDTLAGWCSYKGGAETGARISDLASEYRDVAQL
jgi:hypothetical protein